MFLVNLNLKIRQTSTYDRSFASTVLDKAVMDNLDLTFTENRQSFHKPHRRTWTKKPSRVSNDTLFNDEIDRALESIPENLDFSINEKSSVKPSKDVYRPSGILKPAKPSATESKSYSSGTNYFSTLSFIV